MSVRKHVTAVRLQIQGETSLIENVYTNRRLLVKEFVICAVIKQVHYVLCVGLYDPDIIHKCGHKLYLFSFHWFVCFEARKKTEKLCKCNKTLI